MRVHVVFREFRISLQQTGSAQVSSLTSDYEKSPLKTFRAGARCFQGGFIHNRRSELPELNRLFIL